jgi:hypothetical protein
MNPFRLFLAATLATLSPLPACAQTSEAARYTNQQGIEIIQNRPAEQTAGAGKAPVEAAKPRAPEPATVKDARFQVSAKDQAERDRDRLAILRQELLKEMEGYQAKNKILHSPSMQASLTDDQLQRVRDTAHTHEQNIRDLNSEINRALRSSKN